MGKELASLGALEALWAGDKRFQSSPKWDNKTKLRLFFFSRRLVY